MSDNAKIRVTIEDAKRIPRIGKGPIRNPIVITRSHYDLLKTLGFKVNIVNENLNNLKINNILNRDDSPLIKDDSKEEFVNEETIEDGEIINNDETPDIEDEEVVDNEESNKEDVIESEESTEDEEVVDNEESNKEEVVDNEESNKEDVIESEESTEDEEDVVEEEIDLDSMTKKEIKEQLDEMGVKYKANANLTELKKIFMDNIED